MRPNYRGLLSTELSVMLIFVGYLTSQSARKAFRSFSHFFGEPKAIPILPLLINIKQDLEFCMVEVYVKFV